MGSASRSSNSHVVRRATLHLEQKNATEVHMDGAPRADALYLHHMKAEAPDYLQTRIT